MITGNVQVLRIPAQFFYLESLGLLQLCISKEIKDQAVTSQCYE